MTLWENLNLSELKCLLESGIKVYTYKVLSTELAYRKQLVDVAFMMVRQGWEKQNEMEKKNAWKTKIRADLPKLWSALSPALLAHRSLNVFWFGPLVLDPLHS